MIFYAAPLNLIEQTTRIWHQAQPQQLTTSLPPRSTIFSTSMAPPLVKIYIRHCIYVVFGIVTMTALNMSAMLCNVRISALYQGSPV